MWKDVLTYNRAERRGVWMLCLLTAVLLGMNIWFPFIFRDDIIRHPAELALLQNTVNEIRLEKSQEKKTTYKKKPAFKNKSPHLPAKKETFLKQSNQTGRPQYIPDSLPTIDLNYADSLTLVSLPGIGKTLSARILKYRDLLGGFISTSQLLEVYGVKKDWFSKFEYCLVADPNAVRSIDFEQGTFKQILSHPYMNYEMTKEIFGLRRSGQLMQHPDTLLVLLGCPDSLKILLRPYLR